MRLKLLAMIVGNFLRITEPPVPCIKKTGILKYFLPRMLLEFNLFMHVKPRKQYLPFNKWQLLVVENPLWTWFTVSWIIPQNHLKDRIYASTSLKPCILTFNLGIYFPVFWCRTNFFLVWVTWLGLSIIFIGYATSSIREYKDNHEAIWGQTIFKFQCFFFFCLVVHMSCLYLITFCKYLLLGSIQ